MATAAKKKPPVPTKKPVAKAPVKKPVPTKPVAKKPAPVAATPKASTVFKPAEKPADKPIDKIAGAGHNSPVSKAELKKIIDNIENLEVRKQKEADFIKEAYTSAKAKGYDTKAIREVIKIRKADKEKLKAQKEAVDMYLFALDPELADVLS